MEIKIERPIALHLEVFETDDYVPFMHVNAKITVSQFQHTCQYEGAFWIELENKVSDYILLRPHSVPREKM